MIGRKFIGEDSVCLVLGDNLFYGERFSGIFRDALNAHTGATVFAYPVKDPHDFGVCELDREGNVLSIEEKPKMPKSFYAVTGLYLYDNSVLKYAESLTPSERGELEITDINKVYLQKGDLRVKLLDKETVWFDMGTPDALLEAGGFIRRIQKKTGRIIFSPEETAWKNGWISDRVFRDSGIALKHTEYGKYILQIVGEHL